MRIVSLLPSGTEMVAALGLEEALVGISHECDFPASVAPLPRLTSSILQAGRSPGEIDAAVAEASLAGRPLYAVDGHRLTQLKPDLIVTQGVCAVCAVTPATIDESLRLAPLQATCSAPVLSLEAQDFTGILCDLKCLGEAAGHVKEAEALAADLSERWQEAGRRPQHNPAPRVVMLEWPDPPWYAGHWVPEQVALAGGEDLFGRPGAPSQRVSEEAVLAADPDWIFGVACGFDAATNARALRELLARSGWADLRAARTGRVFALDANGLFSRPGPRVIDGAELLADLLRGQAANSLRALRVDPV
ncbi:MAG: cobalamin-binding protein [Myxococcota bacterium]